MTNQELNDFVEEARERIDALVADYVQTDTRLPREDVPVILSSLHDLMVNAKLLHEYVRRTNLN